MYFHTCVLLHYAVMLYVMVVAAGPAATEGKTPKFDVS